MRSAPAALLLALAPAACEPGPPGEPSYQADVLPILAASCIRCHGGPALGGAPLEPRLDSFADLADFAPGDPLAEVPVAGASTYAFAIAVRVRDPDSPMPPRFPLDDWQAQILERWADTGGGRGAPRPGNRPPEIAIERATRTGGRIAVRARVSDPDGDVVAGTLRAMVGGGRPLVGAVRSGTVEVLWDPATVAPGTYPLVALLDDGAEVHEVAAGTIEVGP
jgi:hypothetical protein